MRDSAIPLVIDEVELGELVRRAQDGNQAAIEHLIRHFRPRIYRYCVARLGGREVAEDVTQETCIALANALPTFHDHGRPFAAFVFGIASNKVNGEWRSSSRRREEVRDEVPDHAEAQPGPAQVTESADSMRHLLRHLDTLSVRHQQVLLMRVVAELSAQEVADVLGTTAGNVRVLQHRALTELRERLTTSKTTSD